MISRFLRFEIDLKLKLCHDTWWVWTLCLVPELYVFTMVDLVSTWIFVCVDQANLRLIHRCPPFSWSTVSGIMASLCKGWKCYWRTWLPRRTWHLHTYCRMLRLVVLRQECSSKNELTNHVDLRPTKFSTRVRSGTNWNLPVLSMSNWTFLKFLEISCIWSSSVPLKMSALCEFDCLLKWYSQRYERRHSIFIEGRAIIIHLSLIVYVHWFQDTSLESLYWFVWRWPWLDWLFLGV